MAIRTRKPQARPQVSSRLQSTYFKSSSSKNSFSPANRSRASLKEENFGFFISKFVLPTTLIFSVLSLLLIFIPGLFTVKGSAKAAATKDSVRIITDYTFSNIPLLEKIK